VADLPVSLRRYVALVALAAFAAFALALLRDGLAGPVVPAAALALAAAVAGRFPFHLTAKTKVAADGAFLVAAALLLGPAAAMLVGAGGVGLAQLLRRSSWAEAAFNAAQAALWVGAGGAVLRVLAAKPLAPWPAKLSVVLVVLAAVLAMHLANTLLVAGAGALQEGAPVLPFWRDGLWLDAPAQAAQAAAGTLLAATLVHAPLLAAALALLALFVLLARPAALRGRPVPATQRGAAAPVA